MNCSCYKPAVIRETRTGNNAGKKYWGCASNVCSMYVWCDSHMPPPMRPQIPATSSSSSNAAMTSNNNYNNTDTNTNSSTNHKSNLKKIQFTLLNFEYNNDDHELSAWFGVLISGSSTHISHINKLFLEFPENLRRYKTTFKMWEFNFIVYNELIKRLQLPPCNDYVTVEPLPLFLSHAILTYIAQQNSEYDKIPRTTSADNTTNNEIILNIEDELRSELLPFQVEGVKFIVSRHGRGMIADEMGCGMYTPTPYTYTFTYCIHKILVLSYTLVY